MICQFKMSPCFLIFLLSYTYLTFYHTETAIVIFVVLFIISSCLILLYANEIIQALNEIYYNKDTDIDVFLTKVKVNKDFTECSICLEDFSEEDDDIFKINCPCTQQFFHKDCITNWLKKNCSCPICRKILREKDDD